MATVTNTIAAPALRGQSVKVTLSGAESLSKLPAVTIGQEATISSSSNVGYVDSIDTYGTSFTVAPRNPDLKWESTELGYLAASETITLL